MTERRRVDAKKGAKLPEAVTHGKDHDVQEEETAKEKYWRVYWENDWQKDVGHK